MYKRFIVISCGFWGAGDTIEKAHENHKKAGGKKKNCKTLEFTSELPFAPSNRDAMENEADAYVSTSGDTCWVRCERKTELNL